MTKAPRIETVDFGTPITAPLAADEIATERGTAWHLASRVLLKRPDRRDALSAATGLTDETLDQIAAQVAALDNWLTASGYPEAQLELPLQTLHEDGSETNAVVDWLAIGPEGVLIVDHKSGPAPDPATRFAGYLPQFNAYQEVVETVLGHRVDGYVVNWMSEGRVSLLKASDLVTSD